ncbi:osmotically inducible protein OsmC [Serinibacter arcticus]|uniref:Osmotically inducible protein OsmC n=1 Tax=Serinibacter arcticus TaxID=1655435 RepID=A0A2U1ZSJ6_9MICO|nr:OsmC family protein [Serinibacter arcticus]PWD49957.1 osmotically inducible protein OsmC [Serinibacter arcticus]
MASHSYATTLSWSGSTGTGYRAYSRDHEVSAAPAEQTLGLSADPAFRGSASLLNPEQLVVAAASSCQLLSFLAVAARAGLDVVDYTDDATAVMDLAADPPRLTTIDLHPVVTVVGDREETLRLLAEAHEQCYIANSLRTPVTLHPRVVVREAATPS